MVDGLLQRLEDDLVREHLGLLDHLAVGLGAGDDGVLDDGTDAGDALLEPAPLDDELVRLSGEARAHLAGELAKLVVGLVGDDGADVADLEDGDLRCLEEQRPHVVGKLVHRRAGVRVALRPQERAKGRGGLREDAGQVVEHPLDETPKGGADGLDGLEHGLDDGADHVLDERLRVEALLGHHARERSPRAGGLVAILKEGEGVDVVGETHTGRGAAGRDGQVAEALGVRDDEGGELGLEGLGVDALGELRAHVERVGGCVSEREREREAR